MIKLIEIVTKEDGKGQIRTSQKLMSHVDQTNNWSPTGIKE